jgi:hypothetical protein
MQFDVKLKKAIFAAALLLAVITSRCSEVDERLSHKVIGNFFKSLGQKPLRSLPAALPNEKSQLRKWFSRGDCIAQVGSLVNTLSKPVVARLLDESIEKGEKCVKYEEEHQIALCEFVAKVLPLPTFDLNYMGEPLHEKDYYTTPLIHLICSASGRLTGAFLESAMKQKRWVDVNLPDSNGQTPLEHALRTQNNNAVQYLLWCGADENIVPVGRDETGRKKANEAYPTLKTWVDEAGYINREEAYFVDRKKEKSFALAELRPEWHKRGWASELHFALFKQLTQEQNEIDPTKKTNGPNDPKIDPKSSKRSLWQKLSGTQQLLWGVITGIALVIVAKFLVRRLRG